MAEKEYTVVAPDGKEITLIGPVGASQNEIIAQAQRLYKPTAQPTTATGPYLGGDRPAPIPQQPTPTALDYAKAVYEVPATVVSGAVAPFLGVGKGIVQNIQQGTNERVDRPELAQEFTYQPTSPVSQSILESVGKVLDTAHLAPVTGLNVTPRISQAGQFAPVAARSVVQTARQPAQRLVQALREEPVSTISGVGAAAVPEVNQRVALAQNLRVPVPLTKGQATRQLGQQQFEAEIAKTYPQDIGKPLIDRKLLQNERVLQNFDAFVDATGAEKAGEMNLYEVGKVVDKALVNKARDAKKQINAAYKLADEAGESAEKIDVTPIKSYLDGLKAEEINAPVITSAKIKLADLSKDGQISLNDLEEIRKMVNRVSGSTPTNMAFGKDIIGRIDASTEGKGGDLYKSARKLRSAYAREFENVGVIDKLLSKKPGTTDRSVALEDVFSHSILKGSLDDVRAIGRTLKKAGPDGEQAWKELQGQTIENMKSAVTKNIQRDQGGNPIVSPKQLDVMVKNLDSDGKLDYIFGKKGAQEIRDLRDTAINVYSPVAGINQSNTSSALIQALDRIKTSSLSKIPMAGPVYEFGADILERRKLGKQVQESLEFNPNAVAKELRKGQ